MPGYANRGQVVRIGDTYYITMPYGNGQKRLYLDRDELIDLYDKIGRTLDNDARYQRNGISVTRHGARYQILP